MSTGEPNIEPEGSGLEPDEVDWSAPVMFLYLLGLVDRGVQRGLQKQLAAFELSVPEYSVISILLVSPGLSNADLARRSLVTPQSMNEVIARLERRKLVERSNHPDHGRIRMTSVTKAGRDLFHRAQPKVASFEESLTGDIPEEDQKAVRQHLLGVLDRLKNCE